MIHFNGAPDDKIKDISIRFEHVFVMAREILDDDAFRIQSGQTIGRINVAIMESVYRVLASSSADWLRSNANRVKRSYRRLIFNSEYQNSVRQSTGDTARVRARFRLAAEALGRHRDF